MSNNAVDPNINNSSSPYAQVADPAWVTAAQACGFYNDYLTRDECLHISKKSGLHLPRWLMKDPLRRLGRGKYAIPELSFGVKQTKS